MFRCSLFAALVSLTLASADAEDWPGWRGPRGDGTTEDTELPLRWNGETGDNIVWKVPVPGYGHSSPIVWGDAIFVASCLEGDQQRVLMRFDRETGERIWERTVIDAPLEKKHTLNSYASGTPATDGERIYVTFLDPDQSSGDEATPGDLVVAAYDFAGEQLWCVRPGRFASVHGFCSSPVLFEDLVIINGDHDGDSYLVALEAATGAVRWKIPREHRTRSYVTPIIRERNGRTQMLLSGSKQVCSYDPRSGSRHWYLEGPTEQFVASLVENGELVFVTAGFPEHHILALRPDGEGQLSDAHIVWRTTKGCSYVPSPVVCGAYLIVAADNGIVSCFGAATGERHWMKRLASHYSASLISAPERVYLLADDGQMTVVRPGTELEVLAENPLGEHCYASPAVADGQIFLRSEHHLFCIGKR